MALAGHSSGVRRTRAECARVGGRVGAREAKKEYKEACIGAKAEYAVCSDLVCDLQNGLTPKEFKMGEDCFMSAKMQVYVNAIRSGKVTVN